MRNYLEVLVKVFCMLIMSSILRLANAAEWYAQPSLNLGEEYNSNIQLTLQPHNSVQGSTILPRLALGAVSDNWGVKGELEAVQKRYSGDSAQDRDDRSSSFQTYYKTERSTWQLAGSKSKGSVITSEQVTADTGLVNTQTIYDTHSISPSWTWMMNELTQLQLSYSFSAVTYVNGKTIGLNDYTSRSISAQLTRELNPHDRVFFITGYSEFDVPDTALGSLILSSNSRSATYQAGVERSFSETTKGKLSAGMRNTASEQDGYQQIGTTFGFCPVPSFSCPQYGRTIFHSKETSSVFNGSLDKQFETIRLSLAVSRTFNPSGSGGHVQTDTQTVALDKNYSSRLVGHLYLSNYRYKSEVGNLTASDERHLVTVESGLRWSWTQELSADIIYQYRHFKRVTDDRAVNSNAAYLTVRYAWPRMSISR